MRNTEPWSNPRTSSSGIVLTKRVDVVFSGAAFSSTSRTNARIRSRVSSIVYIGHAAGRADQLSGSKSEIDSTHVDAALANLEDQGLRTAWLCLLDRFFHEQVTVSAGDEVDAIDLRREF